jgi:hypothetical protein
MDLTLAELGTPKLCILCDTGVNRGVAPPVSDKSSCIGWALLEDGEFITKDVERVKDGDLVIELDLDITG